MFILALLNLFFPIKTTDVGKFTQLLKDTENPLINGYTELSSPLFVNNRGEGITNGWIVIVSKNSKGRKITCRIKHFEMEDRIFSARQEYCEGCLTICLTEKLEEIKKILPNAKMFFDKKEVSESDLSKIRDDTSFVVFYSTF